MIVSWPSKIKAGTSSDHIAAFWDVMPTMSDLLDVELNQNTDGISFLHTLFGQEEQIKHDFLHWGFQELGGRQATRKYNWK